MYVEKPLSVYVREGRALVTAARQHQRVVQTGTQQRTMEMDRFACEFVRAGKIGKIRHVECINFRGPIAYPAAGLPEEPVPSAVDWDLWQGPAPARPFNRQLFCHWKDNVGQWWGNWSDYANRTGGHGHPCLRHGAVRPGGRSHRAGRVLAGRAGSDRPIHFKYASGVEVRLRFADEPKGRGPQLGAIFVGEDCKIEINRNKFTTNPPDFIKDRPDPAWRKMGRRRLDLPGTSRIGSTASRLARNPMPTLR